MTYLKPLTKEAKRHMKRVEKIKGKPGGDFNAKLW